MDNNELDGLLALKLVAEKRNFTAAAKDLRVTPSAISQTIQQLEKRLGAPLLIRTTRSTSLSEAGKAFLDQAGPAIDQLLSAMRAVGLNATKPSGTLRINLPRAIYYTLLAGHLRGFAERHPQIVLELFFEDGASDIAEEGFDAGIRLSDILAKDMVAIKLCGPIRFGVAGSPRYFAKHGRPKHPKDLHAHNCIVARLGQGLYDHWEFARRGKDFKVKVKGTMIANDSNIALDIARSGLGLVYTTEDLIAKEGADGSLEAVLGTYATSSSGFFLYYPNRSQVAPKLRAFIDYMNSKN